MRYAVLLLLLVGCTRAQPVAQPTPLPTWTYATPAPWDSTIRSAGLLQACSPLGTGNDGCDDCSACMILDRAPVDSQTYCVPCWSDYPPASKTEKCRATYYACSDGSY